MNLATVRPYGLALIALAALGCAQEPDVVRAQRFEIVDEYGVVRGSFGVTREGASSLQLRDHNDVDRVELTFESLGTARISLNDEAGAPVAQVEVSDDMAFISFVDKSSDTRLGLGLLSSGWSGLGINAKGQSRVAVGHSQQSAFLSLADTNGFVRFSSFVDATGQSSLRLNDALGSAVEASVSEAGRPQLRALSAESGVFWSVAEEVPPGDSEASGSDAEP